MTYSTIWLLIITLTVIIFINRYLFLDPNIKIHIPPSIHRILKYSAPCLLAAICAPIVFFQSGSMHLEIDSPYILASLITIALSFLIKKTIFVVILGLASFYALQYWL